MTLYSVKVLMMFSLAIGVLQGGCAPHSEQIPHSEQTSSTEESAIQLTVLTYDALLPQIQLAANYYRARVYEERGDWVEVSLVTASSQQELINIATAMVAAGESLDVIVADHSLAGDLADSGLVSGYCLPDGGCEACFTENPPRWCWYAQGLEVDVGRIENFSMVGLCDFDTCPDVCLQVPMPPWCSLIHAPGYNLFAPDGGYDVVRGSFAYRDEGWDAPFPLGIPWWWRAHLIWVSEEFGFEPGQQIAFETFEQLINDYRDMLYFDSAIVFDQLGIEAPFEPNLRKGDPEPQPNTVAMLFGFTDTVQLMDEELRAGLVPILVEGYRPQAVVSGAYVVPSGAADVAMDFAYTVFSDEFQSQMAATGEYLPVQNEIFINATQAFLPVGSSDVLLHSAPYVPGVQ